MLENFRNRIIALGHDIKWPPRSPDLTPCDYFLCRYLKNKVDEIPPINLHDFRIRITARVDILKDDPDLVKTVMNSTRKR